MKKRNDINNLLIRRPRIPEKHLEEKRTTEAPKMEDALFEEREILVPEEEQGSSRNLADLVGLLLRILWILLILFVAFRFVVGITVNRGESMSPAFYDRDIVLYYRLAHELVSGDTVVYTGQDGNTQIGRVVAIGGDTVDFTEDGLKINGYSRLEDYGHGETILYNEGPSYPIALKTGEFFVLCDDRSQGDDSRLYGPLREQQIAGRVILNVRHRHF